jgi:SAM-dependent methyltransferase
MIKTSLNRILAPKVSKQDAELIFWQNEIQRYQKWFSGELSPLYTTPSPANDQKIKAPNSKDASILTWHKLHQEAKYLEDLKLPSDAFQGMKLLDVGSGPMPSATCFRGSQLFCIEPHLPKYLEAGFPLHYYGNVTFIHGVSEAMPVESNFFDAVIAVNAIDHVDNIWETASEIRRVLKSGGGISIHVHYHAPTKCEPISINDSLMQKLFGWCDNFRKVGTSRRCFSVEVPDNESFALWSNFENNG